jgi:hypothetical protein
MSTRANHLYVKRQLKERVLVSRVSTYRHGMKTNTSASSVLQADRRLLASHKSTNEPELISEMGITECNMELRRLKERISSLVYI